MNGSSFHRCKLNIYHYHRYPLILKRKHRVKTGCWCQNEYSKWIILCQLNRYQKATRSWSSFQQYAFSTSVTRNRTWCQCLVSYNIYVAFCAIWYHLYNLKNLKNSHGGVLLLVNFTKSNTPPWVFFTFLKLYKWYQIAQSVTYYVMRSFKISLKRARKISFIKTKILLYNKVGNYCYWDNWRNNVYKILAEVSAIQSLSGDACYRTCTRQHAQIYIGEELVLYRSRASDWPRMEWIQHFNL